jgi:hypothetical protein
LSQLSTTIIPDTRIITPCLTNLYLRVHPTPSFLNPKSFIQDICRVNPHQLALTGETLGVGIMNLMTFSLLANGNSKVDGNFQLHPPTLTPVFASLDQEMDLTIGSLNFRVGSLGSIRLSDSTK